MNERNNNGIGLSLGVLSAFLLVQVPMLLTPAINTIAEQYGVSLSVATYATTIVSLMIVPFSLISGAIAGTKVKYKPLAVLAIVLILVGGIGAIFATNSFTMLIICRVIVGIGVGLATPLGNALVLSLFDSQKAANLQGIGTTVQNITGVLLQVLGGVACAASLKYVWILHAFVLIPLVLIVAFLKEPELTGEKGKDNSGEISQKSRLPAAVIWTSLAYGGVCMFFFAFFYSISGIVALGGHDASVAGTVSSLYTIGGIVAGLIFGILFKILKKNVIPVCMCLLIVAFAISYFGAASVFALGLAMFLFGVGIFSIWPACMMDFSVIVPPDKSALAAGIFVAAINVGAFLSSPFGSLVARAMGDSPTNMLMVGTIATVIITIIWTIARSAKKHKV